MNRNDNDMGIDWDKLLDAIDDKTLPAGLTPEELELLANAREMQARLGADKFSEESGWELFTQGRQHRKARIIRLLKIASAAAILVLTLGIGWWMITPAKQSKTVAQQADQRSSNKVQLKLGNGNVLTIDKDTQLLQNNVVKISAAQSFITYEANKNSEQITATDTLDVPRGLQFALQLSDGTKVWVNADSRLIYPSSFNKTAREVYIKGEAYFDIAPDKNHPFIVHAGNTTMKVLGTAFNVNNYSADVVATLSYGKLLVAAETSQTILNPDQQAVYHSKDGSISTGTVETRVYTAWKDGDIFFDDAPLQEIAESLARSYDYDFRFDNAATAKIKFTIDMSRSALLQDVLNKISKSDRSIRFQVNGRTVTVINQP